MSHRKPCTRKMSSRLLRSGPLAVSLLALVSLQPALADPMPLGSNTSAAASPSTNATINLIRLLVQQGVITGAQADQLIAQAEQEAQQARAAERTTVAAGPAPSAEGTMRVTYVPETVRTQIRDEVKQEVMAQAKAENWANPNEFPSWADRISFYGDIRTRYDGTFFPEGNDNTGSFPDFNAINTGSPYDVSESNPNFAPQYNTDEDRNRYRLRARFGVDADLGEGFKAGLRIATGSGNSPVSANQTLGGSGGNFSKYSVWLDRGFLSYTPMENVALHVGRFDNPFFSTNMVWDGDIGFDGLAVEGAYPIGDGLTPFVSAGVFPVFNTSFNFATNQPSKFESHDKWLYALQAGLDWDFAQDFSAKFGAAYYHFENIKGELSDPCTVISSADSCNTDHTRPSFAQKGNSYMALRQIVPVAENNFGTEDQYQYFGLVSEYQPLVLTGRVDYTGFEGIKVTGIGEFAKNLGYDEERLNLLAVNNRRTADIGDFTGGDTAYLLGASVGTPEVAKRWDWNVGVNYRYVESDALVDAFVDSDFGGGGTNVKGFTLGGMLGLSERVYMQARWMSSDEVTGPPFAVDTVQIDLGAKF